MQSKNQKKISRHRQHHSGITQLSVNLKKPKGLCVL